MEQANKKALILVDLQNDFFPGGVLGVALAHLLIPLWNALMAYAQKNGWLIILSRDWHPKETKHFKSFGGVWDEHCVAGSPGARFYPELQIPESAIIISKGMSTEDDGYSAFEGITQDNLTLNDLLDKERVTELFICGLATDYCVKATVLDACTPKYKVYFIEDAMAAVNIHPTDGNAACISMIGAGARSTKAKEVLNEEV